MAYYHGWFKFNSDVVKFLSLSSCCASYLCGFSAHLHQEAVLDRWGQHQHGQHRWHQPQRPLHQPERPCWWVSGSFLWLYKRQHPLVTGQMITTQSCLFSFPFFFFQASPLTLKLSGFIGSARETAPSTAVNWTALDLRCLKGPRASWPRLLLWPSWVGTQSALKLHYSSCVILLLSGCVALKIAPVNTVLVVWDQVLMENADHPHVRCVL